MPPKKTDKVQDLLSQMQAIAVANGLVLKAPGNHEAVNARLFPWRALGQQAGVAKILLLSPHLSQKEAIGIYREICTQESEQVQNAEYVKTYSNEYPANVNLPSDESPF